MYNSPPSPVRLADLLSAIPTALVTRGREYARDGSVTLSIATPTSIAADVRGTERYQVRFEVDDDELLLTCTCPYFASSAACKHIAATAIVADKAGKLAALPAGLDIVLRSETDGDDLPVSPTTVFNRPRAAPLPSRYPPPSPSWARVLDRVEGAARRTAPPTRTREIRELFFVFDAPFIVATGSFALTVLERKMRRDGTWGKIQPARLTVDDLDSITDPSIRALTSLLKGLDQPFESARTWSAPRVRLAGNIASTIIPLAYATGRLFGLADDTPEPFPLRYDDGPPWEFAVTIARDDETRTTNLTGSLRRGDDVLALSAPFVLHAEGWLITRECVAHFEHFGAFELVATLRTRPKIEVPRTEEARFFERFLALPSLPRLDLSESLNLREEAITPEPVLRVAAVNKGPFSVNPNMLEARLAFAYGDDLVVEHHDRRTLVPRIAEGRLVRRDLAFEQHANNRLVELGFRSPQPDWNREDDDTSLRLELPAKKLVAAARVLVREGWRIDAEGKLYRRPRDFDIAVSSGVDWFELNASIDFDGVSASLPELLEAIRAGDGLIRLGDGTFGILPEDWLAKHAMLAQFAPAGSAPVRFRKNQVWLVDALLGNEPAVSVDDVFARARDELRRFDGIAPENPPASFRGELRPYQRVGLGWLAFLRRFGFGGCLADDMGLGKTVQVLAMLDARRGESKKPSLVVVPKSVVWNWRDEAAKFAPQLDVSIHAGSDRVTDPKDFARHDLVITTYGLLRQDIAMLSEIEFDYVILDEAQAIKNAQSDSARAACRLVADHRLALSGTPVENHLGELWSIFEFLNPGMLGAARMFQNARGSTTPLAETAEMLSRALRPFVLRRTKEQVATDLPEKHQETIVCDLDGAQRRLYDELRDHYRANLLGMIAREGLAKSKIQVLEALLRLRQAACHPGLVDKKRIRDSSAKLETIVARLLEVSSEGHKALVFSQFTSFLAIVRARLESEGVAYEYLDGKTVDREARVQRFQNDATCPVFLISLKAGGVGLNLTAADYVFILDPWWNPAVESQAIDRAHRIGQTKRVFVYRLIARNTVEEKVAALQEKKRGLADAIIRADESVLRGLDRETLEGLLG